jgi:XTP/dITP diphosphohydrolase
MGTKSRDTGGITIVLATRNQGKIREIEKILSGSSVRILSLNQFDLPETVEDGADFSENARKKAVETAVALGLPALAEDSGLVVEALGGEPGVRSSRYAGENATDSMRVDRVLSGMSGRTDRRAAFVSVVCVALPSGENMIFEGRCDGLITEEPEGEDGFGYDPIFYYPPAKKTFARMSLDEKNRVSHRARAFLALISKWDEVLAWMRRETHGFAASQVGLANETR